MTPLVSQLNFFLALGTLVSQLLAAGLLGLIIFEWKTKKQTELGTLLSRYALPFVFCFTLVSSALTLVYSEVFGFLPCSLCWFQRIFLYPLIILSGIALVARDGARVAKYLIGLAIPGAVIALYQHYLQMGGSEFVPCPASGAGADCAQRILFEFGYITLPLMSFSGFVLVIVLAILLTSRHQNVQ